VNPNSPAGKVAGNDFKVMTPAPVHGVAGAAGAKGATGVAGATGAKGPTGANGATGLPGPAAPDSSRTVLPPTVTHGWSAKGKHPAFRFDATKSHTYDGFPVTYDSPSGKLSTLNAHVTAAGQFSYEAAASPKALALQGSPLNAVTIPRNRHVHADASLQVVVPNLEALSSATSKATAIATGLGGYAQRVQSSSDKGDGSSLLDLRVPVGKAQVALQKLGSLGRLVSQQVATQDVEQAYSKQSDTLGQLRRKIAVYVQALQSGTLTGTQRVNVQYQLSEARYQLRQLRKAHASLAKYAATSDIQLALSTDQHAFAAPPSKRGRLGNLLHHAAGFLALEATIVLYVIIVLGPILLIAGLIWWLLRERRRREEELLAANA